MRQNNINSSVKLKMAFYEVCWYNMMQKSVNMENTAALLFCGINEDKYNHIKRNPAHHVLDVNVKLIEPILAAQPMHKMAHSKCKWL